MVIDSLAALLTGAASVASVVFAVHWKYKDKHEQRLRSIEQDISRQKESMSALRQQADRQDSKLETLSRDNEKLEGSLQKEIGEVKKAITSLQQLIIDSLLQGNKGRGGS